MTAKKCKCGKKLVLEMDKVRGRCFQCLDHIFMKTNQRSVCGYQNQMQKM